MAIYGTPIVHPGREFERERWSNVFRPFYSASAITGTSQLTVWDPAVGKKFVLKGFSITAVVRTTLAAANPKILGFFDNATSAYVCDAGISFFGTAPIGTWFTASRDLAEGIPSAAADNNLILGVPGDLTTGVIEVMGCVWGEEI